ncbi:MAG: G5 domain-containing protein [Clostridia bacterium]|nr:G5 domain-containing protein [Clostridia bacterium]
MFRNARHSVIDYLKREWFPLVLILLASLWVCFSTSMYQNEIPEEINLPKVNTGQIHLRILVDNQTVESDVFANTVREALEQSNITLGEQDECSLDLEMPVSDGMSITVNRITYSSHSKTDVIPYETVYRATNSLPAGKQKLSEHGENGLKETFYSDRYVNGELEASTKIKTIIKEEVANEVYLVGKLGSNALSPMPYPIDLDAKGQPVHYAKLIKGTCSAYTSDKNNAGRRTSTGKTAKIGYVAVDPKVIPYHTKMYIVSPDGKMVYGYAQAEDTGGTMSAGRAYVDLFMDTYEECIQFGRRQMNIYILE